MNDKDHEAIQQKRDFERDQYKKSDEEDGIFKKGKPLVVKVYLDNGNVFEYKVTTAKQARDHADSIIKTGYRSCQNQGELEHYPPHRISKVKLIGETITTQYPDNVEGT